jgi:hypothetical protein
MKQSEIQAIINQNPMTIFGSNARYVGNFIVVGFVKESAWNNRHGALQTYAQTREVFFHQSTGETTISERIELKALRLVSGVFSDSVESFTAHKKDNLERTLKAKEVRESHIETMNELTSLLRVALKANGIDNKASNYGFSTTFKIEVDCDNAEALLALLNSMTPAEVK